MQTVYIETSVISYLTARPSAGLVTAAHQQITREWWDNCRTRFESFISPLVLDEASRGDPAAAAIRLAAVNELAILEVTESALVLVDALVNEGALPAKAMDDATHVAIAAVHNYER
jgi:hypothetical protein